MSLEPYSAHINELRELGKNWDSYGADAPNDISTQNAQGVIDILRHTGTTTLRVAPIAEGGIIIWLDLKTGIECLNSGQVSLETIP